MGNGAVAAACHTSDRATEMAARRRKAGCTAGRLLVREAEEEAGWESLPA